MKKLLLPPLLSLCLIVSLNSSLAQWIHTNGISGGNISALVVSGTNLFAGCPPYWNGSAYVGGGVFLSTDDGTSWSAVNTGLGNSVVQALAVSGTNLFAATGPFSNFDLGGVFLSTNNGTSWMAVDSGLSKDQFGQIDVYTLAVSGKNLFAGTYPNGVFRSTDNATSWTAVNSGLPYDSTYVSSLGVFGTDLFAGLYNIGLFLSTDNGASWRSASTGLKAVFALAATDTNLFAGTSGGIYLSTNNGTSWSAVNTDTGLTVNALAVFGTNLFAGTLNGVFLPTNNAMNWFDANYGFWPYTSVYALAVMGTNLFAGTNDGVWKRPLSEVITSVEKLLADLPMQFRLSQNYPNPFNPTTTISFSLPQRSFVSLKVFDALGREVSTVVSQELLSGDYSRQWNATNISSGVYFYRLQAGAYSETKKLLLLK